MLYYLKGYVNHVRDDVKEGGVVLIATINMIGYDFNLFS